MAESLEEMARRFLLGDHQEPDLNALIDELRAERDADLSPQERQLRADKARRDAAQADAKFRVRLDKSRQRDARLEAQGLPTPLDRMNKAERQKGLARRFFEGDTDGFGNLYAEALEDESLAPTPLDSKPVRQDPTPKTGGTSNNDLLSDLLNGGY